jgi:hypothetical protein
MIPISASICSRIPQVVYSENPFSNLKGKNQNHPPIDLRILGPFFVSYVII